LPWNTFIKAQLSSRSIYDWKRYSFDLSANDVDFIVNVLNDYNCGGRLSWQFWNLDGFLGAVEGPLVHRGHSGEQVEALGQLG